MHYTRRILAPQAGAEPKILLTERAADRPSTSLSSLLRSHETPFNEQPSQTDYPIMARKFTQPRQRVRWMPERTRLRGR